MKEDKLTEEEWEIMKKHPERGYRIVSATEDFAHVANEVLYHHEWWDGSGYPEGLAGEDIPLLARITAIADAYDAMTNSRVYTPQPKTQQEALIELRKCAGNQFDPELVETFARSLEQEDIQPAASTSSF